MSTNDKIKFQSDKEVYIRNKTVVPTLQTFCDDLIKVYIDQISPIIPFKFFTTDYSWMPVKSTNWVRGFVIMQNSTYEFDELGEVFCSYGGGLLYYGWIGVNMTTKKPYIEWKSLV